MERKDVAENLKWRASDIFATDEAWETEYAAIEAEYSNYDFSKFQGKLAQREVLLDCLRLNDQISRRIEKLYL